MCLLSGSILNRPSLDLRHGFGGENVFVNRRELGLICSMIFYEYIFIFFTIKQSKCFIWIVF